MRQLGDEIILRNCCKWLQINSTFFRVVTVVILDSDLAKVYGVETRSLNQAVRRNQDRFPAEFLFQLTANEASEALRLRSQIVILKAGRGHHRKYLPFAFTEHGALMAATVLNSPGRSP